MKRLPPRPEIPTAFRGVLLFRDDLEDIVVLMEESELSVEFSDSRATFDGLDEVREVRGERLPEITITGRTIDEYSWPEVTLKIDRDITTLTGWPKRSRDVAMISIASILHKKRPLAVRALNPILWWALSLVGLMMFLGGILLLALSGGSQAIEPLAAPTVVTLTLLHLLWLAAFVHRRRRAAVILVRRHERSTFWSRNWEKILLMLAGALIGAVITSLFD